MHSYPEGLNLCSCYTYCACRGGFVESMQMCRLFRPFAYHLKAMKQRKFRAHFLRVQRCLHFAYSSTNSLQRILWSHNIGIVTRKPDFNVCPQQRHRPVCASMQTDLRFCSLLLVGIVSELVHEIFQFATYYALKLGRLD